MISSTCFALYFLRFATNFGGYSVSIRPLVAGGGTRYQYMLRLIPSLLGGNLFLCSCWSPMVLESLQNIF